MNEIEKLYSLAGVEPVYPYTKCYPEFTAEKQIELIKWLCKRGLLNVMYSKDKNTYQLFNDRCIGAFCYDIDTAITSLVQCELDFCAEAEQNEIKNILQD